MWTRVRHVLLPKDYVRYRLSGEHAIDVADASGTLMLDVAKRRGRDEMLAACEHPPRRFCPTVFESPADVRARRRRTRRSCIGLLAGTPIVAGAGDQAAGAVGMGITRPARCSVDHRHVGRRLCGDRSSRRSIRKGRIHTFCHADSRPLARDGRDAGGRAVAALAARSMGRRATTTRPTTR